MIKLYLELNGKSYLPVRKLFELETQMLGKQLNKCKNGVTY